MTKKILSVVLNNVKNDTRVFKIADSLTKLGYHVDVVGIHEDGGLLEKESYHNFTIYRLKLVSKNWPKYKIIQSIKFIEFIFKVLKNFGNYDAFHCNDLDALSVGVFVKLFHWKLKLIYDAHEYETQRAYQGKLERFFLKIFERIFIKYTHSIITVSEPIARAYSEEYHIEKPEIIFNTPHYQKIKKYNIFREKFHIKKETIIFLYQGGLSKRRGILEMAEFIKNQPEFAYVIMGYGPLKNDIIKLTEKYDNLFFHEAVPPEKLLKYTSSADIGVCIEENICKSWDYALPNKMFEYLMAEIPILVSGLSEMKKFVKNHQTGFVIENIYNHKEVQTFLDEVYLKKDSFHEEILKAKEQYNWEKQELILNKIYKKIFI